MLGSPPVDLSAWGGGKGYRTQKYVVLLAQLSCPHITGSNLSLRQAAGYAYASAAPRARITISYPPYSLGTFQEMRAVGECS